MLFKKSTIHAAQRAIRRTHNGTFCFNIWTAVETEFGTDHEYLDLYQFGTKPFRIRIHAIRTEEAKFLDIDRDKIAFYGFFYAPNLITDGLTNKDRIKILRPDIGIFEIQQIFSINTGGRVEHKVLLTQKNT